MSENNRIGEECWYKKYDTVKRDYTEWRRGYLRMWSTDHEEFDSGPGPFPVGVIEDVGDGMARSIHVARICFAELPPHE